jgi:hypothetical protein
MEDLLKSGLGAVIGFALAQLVNLIKLGYQAVTRPKLRIEHVGDTHQVVNHSAQADPHGELLSEVYYGFYVRNAGRRIASHVRFQILKIETRGKDATGFREVSSTALDLSTYTGSEGTSGSREVTLLPGARALIELAWWREDNEAVFPAIGKRLEYYEEACQHAREYRFTVAAFDDDLNYSSSTLVLQDGRFR